LWISVARKADPLQEPVALDRAGRRRKSALGLAVGHVLQERPDFGEDRAVVQTQRRHGAFRVDLQEILARSGPLGAEVHFFGVEGHARLVQGDVDGHRAGAGRVVELHDLFPPVVT
jgi:hypothetical protein